MWFLKNVLCFKKMKWANIEFAHWLKIPLNKKNEIPLTKRMKGSRLKKRSHHKKGFGGHITERASEATSQGYKLKRNNLLLLV